MLRHILAVTLVLLAVVATAGVVWAQVSSSYDLSWNVVSSGGREGMASSSYMIHGTLSQFAIGPATGSQYGVNSGYWYGIRRGAEYRIYLPLVLRSA